jgi:hypothetical protein
LVTVDGVGSGKLTQNGSQWEKVWYGGLSEGVYTIDFSAQDLAGNSGSDSATLTVDGTDPTLSLDSLSESSPYAVVSGDTLYYGPNGSGSFILNLNVSDDAGSTAGAGLDEVTFPATTSAGTTLQLNGVLNDTVSHPYSSRKV